MRWLELQQSSAYGWTLRFIPTVWWPRIVWTFETQKTKNRKSIKNYYTDWGLPSPDQLNQTYIIIPSFCQICIKAHLLYFTGNSEHLSYKYFTKFSSSHQRTQLWHQKSSFSLSRNFWTSTWKLSSSPPALLRSSSYTGSHEGKSKKWKISLKVIWRKKFAKREIT